MKKNIGVIIAAVLCVFSIIGMITALYLTGEKETPFLPPEFDSEAIFGIPMETDESYIPIYKEGMTFSAHICGRVAINDGAADIYFTNDEGNKCLMKLRIIDEKGNILAETGLIKPGEYIKSVKFNTVPSLGTKIKMKIMTYEPETYYSAGSISLNTTIVE